MEIDVLVEEPRGLFPIEIKPEQSFQTDFLAGLKRFLKYAGTRTRAAGLVYGGYESCVMSAVTVRSWKNI